MRPMNICRRIYLVWLAAGAIMAVALIQAASAQDGQAQAIDVRIENREVVTPSGAIRITQGDRVELSWTSDEPVGLHLHGYDLEIEVKPGEAASMIIEATATGRFPITSHGWGSGGHGHDALTYLEVYPR